VLEAASGLAVRRFHVPFVSCMPIGARVRHSDDHSVDFCFTQQIVDRARGWDPGRSPGDPLPAW
jgi:hypothetical protein